MTRKLVEVWPPKWARMVRFPVACVQVVACAGCGVGRPPAAGGDGAGDRKAVISALEQYQVAARSVNPDSIAAFYTPTGTLFEPGIFPVKGRDSIRAFVAGFPGAKVEVATATADTIEMFGDTALLWGSYFEKLSFPGQPVSEQSGKFVTEWRRQPDGRWLIEKMFRVPLPSAAPPGR